MQTIFLVRHGETAWNAEDRMQGQVQHVRLNEKGIRQSKLLANRLAGENIDVVYSSPMERALQTAEIISEVHGVSIITHSGLAERTHGSVDGMTRKEFRQKHPKVWEVYNKTRELPGIEGAESTKDLEERGFKAFEEIVKGNPGKNILIVAHGGIAKNIIMHLTGMNHTHFSQHNCCLNVIKFDGKEFRVEKIDDISHLKMELD